MPQPVLTVAVFALLFFPSLLQPGIPLEAWLSSSQLRQDSSALGEWGARSHSAPTPKRRLIPHMEVWCLPDGKLPGESGRELHT